MLTTLFLALALFAPLDVQGHRGARAARPENTLAAFDYALSVGVDTLELDVGVTRDDQLVVLHEPALDPARCLDAAGKRLPLAIPVRTLTLAQVKAYDCGALPHPRFPGQVLQPGARVPTLAEVFALVRDSAHPAAKRVRFNIETKLVPGRPADAPTPAAFAALVVQAVRAAGVIERTTIQSFDERTLQAVAALEPTLGRAILIGENLIDHVAVARSAKAGVVSPHHRWITAASVARMHAAGLRVVPWTLNSPEAWARALTLGVDGIISDDPAGLLAWLRAQGRR